MTKALGGYTGLVHRVLTDPQHWLGLDDDPPPTAPAPLRFVDALRDHALGPTTPASRGWARLPVQKRVDWWLRRIAVSAGLAAAHRLAGARADRLPLQAALSASAAGLAVCATAREHGISDAAAWVPLLATVLFDRHLTPRHVPVPDAATTQQTLAAASAEAAETPTAAATGARKLGAGAHRAAGTVWQLARGLEEMSSMLEDRPHGPSAWRVIGKLPVVGVAGGWLAEWSAIRRASTRTTELVCR